MYLYCILVCIYTYIYQEGLGCWATPSVCVPACLPAYLICVRYSTRVWQCMLRFSSACLCACMSACLSSLHCPHHLHAFSLSDSRPRVSVLGCILREKAKQRPHALAAEGLSLTPHTTSSTRQKPASKRALVRSPPHLSLLSLPTPNPHLDMAQPAL
jgi:hypothetical protein